MRQSLRQMFSRQCRSRLSAAAGLGFAAISRFFAAQGTTGWLCSILTDSEERTLWSIAQARAAMDAPIQGARLLGIHLKGPFLFPDYKGAMPEHLLRTGDAALFRSYRDAAGGTVRYLTAAPEVPGVVEMVEEISDRVTVAIGHPGADFATAIRAIDAGARAYTHAFNAMALFHQRRPAIMGAVLKRSIFCEALCDGRHLHPGTVRMLLASKGWDRVVVVTDSIQAAGLPDGQYKLRINDVVVRNGDAVLAGTGVRAGSTLTTGQALKNLVRFTGESVERALRKQAGMSQEKLAEKLNVSRQAVTKWETDMGIPDMENMMAVSALFDVSLDELLSDKKGNRTKADYLFESVTEYDIDRPKRYDLKFGGAKQLVLAGYDGEKIRVRLASNTLPSLQSDFKIKIDDINHRIDVELVRRNGVTEAAAKEAVSIFVQIPSPYLGRVELAVNVETVELYSLECGSVAPSLLCDVLCRHMGILDHSGHPQPVGK